MSGDYEKILLHLVQKREWYNNKWYKEGKLSWLDFDVRQFKKISMWDNKKQLESEDSKLFCLVGGGKKNSKKERP